MDLNPRKNRQSSQKRIQSSSQMINRLVWEPAAFEKMLEQIEKNPLSDEAGEAIEQVVAGRNKPKATPH